MKKTTELILALATLGATYVGALIYGSSTGRVEERTETYQGCNVVNHGEQVVYVFDNSPLLERQGPPLRATLKDKQEPEIGKRYNLTVNLPKWKFTRLPNIERIEASPSQVQTGSLDEQLRE